MYIYIYIYTLEFNCSVIILLILKIVWNPIIFWWVETERNWKIIPCLHEKIRQLVPYFVSSFYGKHVINYHLSRICQTKKQLIALIVKNELSLLNFS